MAAWFARRRGVPDVDPDGVLPTIGSKELVAWLPTLLGLGADDVVGIPAVAYPTYDVGARLAGATPVVVDGLAAYGPQTTATRPKLLWVNSPSNPTGAVLGSGAPRQGRRVGPRPTASWWRRTSATPSSAGPDEPVPSILDPEVCGGSHEGLLAVYSLSKQSNLAGYRAAFVAGDVALVRRLLEVRKHAGMIVPWPVQRAMLAALGDDDHVAEQKQRYAARRATPAGDAGARPGSGSTRPPRGSTSGPPVARTRGPAWPGWPSAGCSWRRAPSTARPAPSTSGWP